VLQAFDSNGWLFHKQLARDFGGLVKLNGLFGVRWPRTLNCPSNYSDICSSVAQDKFLYVSDPKALQHIVLKDQHIFEETESFIQYVDLCPAAGIFTKMRAAEATV
jgi:hypothetical protein